MESLSAFADALPSDAQFATIGDATVVWRIRATGDEYGALRGASALLDLSGSGLIAVEGADADDFLSRMFTRDIEFLSPETSVMGLMLDDDAMPVDLVTIFRTDDGFLVETSIGRAGTTLAHLESNRGDDDVTIVRRGDLAMFGFEGPASWNVAEQLFDEPITGLPFQGVRPVTIDGRAATVARSGFTGEFGFKVIVATEDALAAWQKAAAHAQPIGLESLEIAMTETRQPMLHREVVGDDAGVIACGLNWLVDLEKEEFVGRDALLAARDTEPETLTVSFVSAADELAPGMALVAAGGERLGHIVHAVCSPGLDDEWCGIARVAADCAGSGLVIGVEGGTSTVTTASAPVRIPGSWGELITAQLEQGM